MLTNTDGYVLYLLDNNGTVLTDVNIKASESEEMSYAVSVSVLQGPGVYHAFLAPDYILTLPESTSVNDIMKLISTMRMQVKYDIVGAAAYCNVALKINDYKKSSFVKYANEHHINQNGGMGFLTYESSNKIYDSLIEWQERFDEGWKEEWEMLFK